MRRHGGPPLEAFSAAAWRSLAVSMYVGSRSEPCRQQVAALLWQVGVRTLSTETAMHVYVDVIKVHIYTCSEARLQPAHGSKPVPEDRGPSDYHHIITNHHNHLFECCMFSRGGSVNVYSCRTQPCTQPFGMQEGNCIEAPTRTPGYKRDT